MEPSQTVNEKERTKKQTTISIELVWAWSMKAALMVSCS